MGKYMQKILIIDDCPVVRRGIVDILRDFPSNSKLQIEETEGCPEALKRFIKEGFHLMIVEIAFKKINGLELIKTIKKESPHQNILAFSHHDDEKYGLRAIRAGANGYLCKFNPIEAVRQAIGQTLYGGKYTSSILTEKLVQSLQNGNLSAPHEQLSDRELEVMKLLLKGKKLEKIAKKLSLSINTVKTYNHRIYKKLSIENKTQLLHYAYEYKILEPNIPENC